MKTTNGDPIFKNGFLKYACRFRRSVPLLGISTGVSLAIDKILGLVNIDSHTYMTWFFYRLGLSFIVGFVIVASLMLLLSIVFKDRDVSKIESLALSNPARTYMENAIVGAYAMAVAISTFLCFVFTANLLALTLTGNFK